MRVCFFFNDTATTEIYTLSLHDALPICDHPPGSDHPRPDDCRDALGRGSDRHGGGGRLLLGCARDDAARPRDRKSTRLNSSHANISYAVFCLKKKKTTINITTTTTTTST